MTTDTESKHDIIYMDSHSHTGHKVRQTRAPVVDSHMVSDKSPMVCLGVQMAPPICLFNTTGMWRTKCAKIPSTNSSTLYSRCFKRHFGCVPDVRPVIRQNVLSCRQLHKNDRDVRIIFLDSLSLSQVSAITPHYQRRLAQLKTLNFVRLSC